MNARIRTGWKSGLLLTLSMMILIFAATALAQDRTRGSRRGGARFTEPGQRLELLAERLDLTEEQTTAIEKIRSEGREQAAELRKEIMRLRNELEGEMLKDEPSDQVVLDLTRKIGNLRTELDTHRVEQRLEVRKQLTPEQRDRLLLMGREKRGERGGRSGRGGHGFRHRGDHECDGTGPGQGRGRRADEND